MPNANPRYQVQTLDEAGFREAARSLNALVADYAPSMLIGIRTGGYVLAEAMAQTGSGATRILPITCRRPSTAAKANSSLFRKVVKSLPYWATDILRVIEHRMVARKQAPAEPSPRTFDQAELEAIDQACRDLSAPRILVVDDAVDSGATLRAVLTKLQAMCPAGTSIQSGALTVTIPKPVAMPDFTLYRLVLLRFPWSFDFRAGRVKSGSA